MVLESFAMPKTKGHDDDTDVVYKDVVIVGKPIVQVFRMYY